MVGADDEPAKDQEWTPLQPAELYLVRGDPVPSARPFFQGDIFRDVPVPYVERSADGSLSAHVYTNTVMVMPHPCSCYHGDDLRPRLTVASIEPVPTGQRITSVQWRTLNYFPLPEVRDSQDGLADIGELATVPTDALPAERRIACLSLIGVAWLHKRILKYTTRRRWLISNLEAELLAQWEDVEVWQSWIRAKGTPQGYESWKRSIVTVAGVGDVKPQDVIPGRTPHLIAHLEGVAPPE